MNLGAPSMRDLCAWVGEHETQLLASALDHPRICVAAFGKLLGGAARGDLVHLLADLGLVDGDLHDQVDDVAGNPVERQA